MTEQQNNPAHVTDLKDLTRQIYEVFDGDKVDKDRVTEILEAYKSNPSDWEEYAKFDKSKWVLLFLKHTRY